MTHPTQLSTKVLLSRIEQLCKEIAALKCEKADLELMMETSIVHGDQITEDLMGKVEETLRESEKQYKIAEEKRILLVTAIEQCAESIIITDRKGNIEYINPAFERIMGYSRQEIIGRNFRILRSDKHDPSFFRSMWQSISDGQIWTGRITNRKKDNTLCESETTISPVRDGSDIILNYVSVNRDVTHEIQMEQQLHQSQKLEAIGTLAGGIAHDFNNILTAIFGYTELAMMNIPPESTARNHLEKAIIAANRAKNLVMQILTFCRQTEHERKPLQLRIIIKEACYLLRATIPATIDIRRNIRCSSDTVIADPTQIHQVLMNLGTNAAHAMREKGGVLDIILEDIYPDKDFALQHPAMKAVPYLRLSVRDTGHGMSREIMDRIFDPFFTTKKMGEGTGMGLAVVHGIIRSHGGIITVESEPGKGSAFHVYLPQIPGKEKKKIIKESSSETPETGHERILFVDDEPDLGDIVKEMLEQIGYEVLVMTDSVNAFKLLSEQPYRFDLVITDQTMPNMTGKDLAEELFRIRPDMPIILCSGYSDRINEETAKKIGIRDFLSKPFSQYEISGCIRNVLDSK